MDMEIIYEALRSFDEKRTNFGHLAVGRLSLAMSAIFLDIEAKVDQSRAEDRKSMSFVRTGDVLSPNDIVKKPPLPERLRYIAVNGINHRSQQHEIREASYEIEQLQAENTRLEDQHEQIMLAICGGEDAPGYAATLGVDVVNSIMMDRDKWLESAREEAGLLKAENERLRENVLEEAAQIAEDLRVTFGSSEYAVGQPASSFSERFACGQVAEAIRAAKETGT